MKRVLFVTLISLLSACSMSEQNIRKAYATHYHQNDAYVSAFKEKIAPLTVEEIAKNAAKQDKARLPSKIGKNLYGKDVIAEKNVVIFEYEFNSQWWSSLSESEKVNIQQNMQKDLIYRTCSLRTVALVQEKGLEESHRYYLDYSKKKLAFELKTSKQICSDNGFNEI